MRNVISHKSIMNSIYIKESDSKYLEFYAPEKHHKLEQLDYFSVRYKSQAVECVASVYAYEDGHRLAGIFKEMAENWKGWSGSKEWAALEEEFSISCSITSTGIVTAKFFLTPGLDREWELKSSVSFGAGELEVISKHMAKFFYANSL